MLIKQSFLAISKSPWVKSEKQWFFYRASRGIFATHSSVGAYVARFMNQK